MAMAADPGRLDGQQNAVLERERRKVRDFSRTADVESERERDLKRNLNRKCKLKFN
jgi:hypothetical protein